MGEGNGNPLRCSCLENPRDGRASWAAVYGVAQSQTWLKQLSSSSRSNSSSLYYLLSLTQSRLFPGSSLKPFLRVNIVLETSWNLPHIFRTLIWSLLASSSFSSTQVSLLWVQAKNIFGIAFKSEEDIPWGSEVRKIKTFNIEFYFSSLGSISEKEECLSWVLVSLTFSILSKTYPH